MKKEIAIINTKDYLVACGDYEGLSCDEAWDLYFEELTGPEPVCYFNDTLYEEAIKDFIKEASGISEYWLFSGKIEVWNKTYECEVKVFTIEEMIDFLRKADLENWEAILYNNEIEGKGYHHDGTNHYYLKALKSQLLT